MSKHWTCVESAQNNLFLVQSYQQLFLAQKYRQAEPESESIFQWRQLVLKDFVCLTIENEEQSFKNSFELWFLLRINVAHFGQCVSVSVCKTINDNFLLYAVVLFIALLQFTSRLLPPSASSNPDVLFSLSPVRHPVTHNITYISYSKTKDEGYFQSILKWK